MSDWNLNDLYDSLNSKSLQSDLLSIMSLCNNFRTRFVNCDFHIDLLKLRDAIVSYEEIAELLCKISAYTFLYSTTRLNDSKIVAFTISINEKLSIVESKMIFFTIAISKLPVKIIDNWCEKDKFLARYKNWIDMHCRVKKNLLSVDVEEALLQKKITSCDGWNQMHSEMLAGIKILSDGEEKNLSEVIEIANHSRNELVRKKNSCLIGKSLDELSFYVTHIYNNIMKDYAIEENLRNWPLPESFRHFENNIEQSAVDNLYVACLEKYSQTSHRYYKIKSKLMGKEKLEYWDRNAPIRRSDILTKTFSYQQACEYVLSVFADFSEKFTDIARKFINEKWIDVYPKAGKSSGAFSCTSSSNVHPYILLNFQGNWRDVATLAHELGHGIHQTLAASNGILLAETPITMSEIASLFCEKLLFEKILSESKNDYEKIDLLCSRLDDTINTVMRQNALFSFERQCHRERGEQMLSCDYISQLWMDNLREYCGDFVNIDPIVSSYWCYIAHFFKTPFYVYAYAFGELFVNALYKKYKSMGLDFVFKYEELLANGGIEKYNVAAMKFDLNPLEKSFWETGMLDIERQIDYLEKLCDSTICD